MCETREVQSKPNPCAPYLTCPFPHMSQEMGLIEGGDVFSIQHVTM